MTPNTYKTPLRVTWEVPAEIDAARAIYAKILEAKALFLDAEIDPITVYPLAGVLGAKGPKTTVIAGTAALNVLMFDIPAEVAKKLTAIIFPPYPQSMLLEGLSSKLCGLELGIESSPEGLEQLDEALSLAEESGGVNISIVNPHAPADPLSKADREAAMKTLKKHPGVDPKRFHVHDLFLASDFGLNPLENYAGCQAGAMLAHVNRLGHVLACRTLPVYLGDLNTQSFAQIWKSPKRLELRRIIESERKGCAGCAHISTCKGGCPGLADETGRDRTCLGGEFNG